MKKKRFLSLFLLLSLLVSLFLTPEACAYEDFDLDARAGLLIEANTGEVLFEKNAHQENYPASVTKVMTALLVLEAVESGELSLSQSVTASEEAFAGLPTDASNAGIKVGETLTVEQLLYCLLVPSGNESANILAQAVSGSIDSFVALMNSRAAELGCEHTYYVNPHGLHDANHYTSAWDIYLVAREAMKHELFMTICNAKSYEIPATNVNEKPRTLHSTNYLISNWRALGYLYNGAQGIKTGSTDEAGYCFVSSAVRGSRTLISVVLGAERRKDPDDVVRTYSFIETSRLFDWGFDNFTSQKILSADEPICEVPVTLSSETNYVVVHPAEDLTRMLPNNLTVEDIERTVTLHSESAEAPIAAGDELGTLTLSCRGTVYGEIPLIALSDVSASWLLVARRDVIAFFSRTIVKLILFAVLALIVVIVLLRIVFSRRRRRRAYSGSRSSGYRGSRRRR